MKLYPIISVTVGNKKHGFGNRAFWYYEREARNRFIKDQVRINGKENVKVELLGRL